MDSICVYCEDLLWSEDIVCFNCNEYDGVMLLTNAVSYLGRSLEDLQGVS